MLNSVIISVLAVVIAFQESPLVANEGIQPCQRKLAENAFHAVLKATESKSIATANFELIEKNLVLLGSIKEKSATKKLVELLDFYIGESTGEILGQIVVEKRSEALPYLEKALRTQSLCNPKIHQCTSDRNGHIKQLAAAAKSGSTYGAGESIAYLNASQVQSECSKVK